MRFVYELLFTVHNSTYHNSRFYGWQYAVRSSMDYDLQFTVYSLQFY